MVLLRVDPLPAEPLAASARFHAHVLPGVLAELARGHHLTLVFEPAGHDHRGWRLALIQSLAREHAPLRINALAGADAAAITAAAEYLATAEGVTGQYLALDGDGAGEVYSART